MNSISYTIYSVDRGGRTGSRERQLWGGDASVASGGVKQGWSTSHIVRRVIKKRMLKISWASLHSCHCWKSNGGQQQLKVCVGSLPDQPARDCARSLQRLRQEPPEKSMRFVSFVFTIFEGLATGTANVLCGIARGREVFSGYLPAAQVSSGCNMDKCLQYVLHEVPDRVWMS